MKTLVLMTLAIIFVHGIHSSALFDTTTELMITVPICALFGAIHALFDKIYKRTE